MKKFLFLILICLTSLQAKDVFFNFKLSDFSKNITSSLKVFDFEKEFNKEKLNSLVCSYKPNKTVQSNLVNSKEKKSVWTKANIPSFTGEGVLEIRSRRISQVCAFHYSETRKEFVPLPFYPYDWIQKLAFRYYHIYVPELREPINLYLFVKQDVPHHYDIWLYNKENFLDTQRVRNFFFGIYYGFVIIFLVFSLLLFFTTKELSQLYYFFLVIGLVSTDAYFSGNLKLILDEFLTTNVFLDRAILLFTQIFTLLLLHETMAGILKSNRVNLILQNLIFAVIAGIPIIVFIPEMFFLPIFYIISLFIISLVFWIFLQAILSKELMSIIIMFSFSVLIITSFINILVILNIFPERFFVQDNIKIGILALILIHSLVLSYKTHLNQKQILESSYLLEQRIQERTLQLTQTIEELKEKDSNFQSHLNLASELQRSLFPNQNQKYPLIEFQIFQRGILQVVGDFFDVFAHNDGSISFFIADASGHGVPAALLTTLCKITIRDAVLRNSEPATALVEINQRLTNVLKTHNYITLFLFTLNVDGKLKFANAGHNPIFLYRKKSSTLETISAKGGFLGIQIHKQGFEQKEIQIQKGDRILLFTDGFAHLLNIKKAKQQVETLKNIFLKNQNSSLQESFERIIQDWSSNKADNKEDDVTFVMIEYIGNI